MRQARCDPGRTPLSGWTARGLEATITAALAEQRLSLSSSCREWVRFALAALTRELVAAELAGARTATPGNWSEELRNVSIRPAAGDAG